MGRGWYWHPHGTPFVGCGCGLAVGLSTHQQPDVCLWGALGVCQPAYLVLQPRLDEPGGGQWDSLKNAFQAQVEMLV